MGNHGQRSGHCRVLLGLLVALTVGGARVAVALPQKQNSSEELLALSGEVGRSGGRPAVSLRSGAENADR